MEMKNYVKSRAFLTVFANDNDALIPELWANETLMVLENNMVMSQLVHRDFEPILARYGDVVNTRRPAKFTHKIKIDTEDVTIQDAQSSNVQVMLNRWGHVSFMIYDGEETKSFKDLVDLYLNNAVMALAKGIDESLTTLVYNFIGKPSAGRLGVAADSDTLVELREAMNSNAAPMEGRKLVLSNGLESDLLKERLFTDASQVGDAGTALREASLGRKFGFDTYMSQNMPSIAAGQTTVAGAINLGAGYVAGTTTITVDGFSAAISNGSWFTIAGDDTPQRVISTVGGSTPTSITFWPGLVRSVVDNAVVTIVTPTAVNFGAGYAASYHLPITVDSTTIRVGQLVSFGTSTNTKIYGTLTGTTSTSFALNRNLDSSVADNDIVGKGPSGNFGLAFVKNAIALVSRPLAAPKAGAGALSTTVSFNGISVRVTISYNSTKQGHMVTIDTIYGTKVLDDNLGAVIYG